MFVFCGYIFNNCIALLHNNLLNPREGLGAGSKAQ